MFEWLPSVTCNASIFYVLIYLVLATVLYNRYPEYLDFTNQENEAQRSPNSHW